MTPVESPAHADTDQTSSPFYQLLQQIPLQCFEQERFLQSELLGVQVYPQRGILVLAIRMTGSVSPETYAHVSRYLKESLPNVNRVVLDVHYPPSAIGLSDYLAAHEKDLLFCVTEEAEIAEGWLSHYQIQVTDKVLSFQVPHELARQQLDRKLFSKHLQEILKSRCGLEAKVELMINPMHFAGAMPAAAEESSAEISASKAPQPVILLGRKIAEEPQSMDVKEESNGFVAQGEIIMYEQIQTRSGRFLIKMTITDYNNSLDVRFFHENDGKFKGGLKERDWVRVRGDLRPDKYSHDELTLSAKDIMKMPPPESRQDNAAEKRVELHCHTQMSRMDGLSKIDRLIEKAAKLGASLAIAITDHGVVQAYPEARAAAKKHGIKLILGMEGYLVDEFKREKGMEIYHIILLVRNKKGLKNLYKMVSESHMKYFYKRPLIPRALLEEHREGIVVGSACEQGEVWQNLLHKGRPLEEVAAFYDYIEIQPCANNEFMIGDGIVKDMDELQKLTRVIYDTAKKLGKPVVATGDSHFIEPQDEVYRRILQSGMGYGLERQAPLYFKTTDELKSDFSYFGDEIAHELVVKGPRMVAEMVEDVEPLPTQTLSPMWEGADQELRETATKKALELYGAPLPDFIEKRLQKELNAIIDNKFSTLYVIAKKLVQKSLSDGYIVGSRGSVGSSFVAFLCGITEVNPLMPHWRCKEAHWFEFPPNPSSMAGVDLPEKNCPKCGKEAVRDGFSIAFEVFMGFKGDKMPDIDLNFSGEYQHVAHKYVEELFGKEHCFRAGTISAVQDRIAFGFVKKFVEEAGRTARNAELNRLVKGCSGVSKTTGQHPGGIVILPKDMEITDVCPVQYPADNKDGDVITTHFDYNSMHDCLVKLDILGHDNPTSLKRLEGMTGVSAIGIPLNDPETMSLFSSTKALEAEGKDRQGPGNAGGSRIRHQFRHGHVKGHPPHQVRAFGPAFGFGPWDGRLAGQRAGFDQEGDGQSFHRHLHPRRHAERPAGQGDGRGPGL